MACVADTGFGLFAVDPGYSTEINTGRSCHPSDRLQSLQFCR